MAKLITVTTVTYKTSLEDNPETGRVDIVVKRETRTHKEDGLGRERDHNWEWESVLVLTTGQAAELARSIVEDLGWMAHGGGDKTGELST